MTQEWVKDKIQAELKITQKSLMRISTGASKVFLTESTHTPENEERVRNTIGKIADLVRQEFADLDDVGRTGISIILATTWCLSILMKLDEVSSKVE